MKIVENNYMCENTKPIMPDYPRKLTCEVCGSKLEYDESDLRMGAWGCMYVDCPCCGRDNMLEDNEHSITLTKDNIEFPTHFWHTSVETGAVDICNTPKIREIIKDGVKYFRKNKDEFVWHYQCGNLSLVIFRYDGDEVYDILATNNFHTTYVPFEPEDYKL